MKVVETHTTVKDGNDCRIHVASMVTEQNDTYYVTTLTVYSGWYSSAETTMQEFENIQKVKAYLRELGHVI